MSFVAIIGAGAIGGSLAHTLAARDAAGEVRLIDTDVKVAEGKALDILQSGPVGGFSTRLSASSSFMSAAGADAIVIADHASGKGEHGGEAGLALMRQLVAIESRAPIVFAGAGQRELMQRTVIELHVGKSRIVGAAPGALESALRALAGLLLDGSGVEVSLRIVGVPPHGAVIAWEEATAFGQPIASEMPPHLMSGLSARLPGLWPPGPYALASAAARVVEAVLAGGRRRFSCFVADARGRVAALPVELGADGIRKIHQPVLTPQERTLFETAIDRF
jgi:malate dehydrogenase